VTGQTPQQQTNNYNMKRMNKPMNWMGCVIVASGFMLNSVSQAALYFFDNGSGVNSDYATGANWNPDGVPGNADLAVVNSAALPALQITSNVSADSLRSGDGGTINHTAGTLTIANGFAGDNGLWIPEFGPAPTTYTLSGGVIQINDPGDGFMVARGGGSQGTLTFTSGSITNTVGDTHIGLDGVAYWYQSGGNFRGAGVQIGRFASPYALAQLSGNARWDVGLVLLADGHGVFNPRNAGPVDLTLIGSNVVYNSTGLVAMKEANITFDGTGGGLSTMHLGGGIMLLDDAELYLSNLPTPTATNQTIVLFDNIGSFPGPDTQFINAVNGTIYAGGSFDWQLQYQGAPATNIVLVSVPGCVAPSISLQPVSQQVVVSNAVTFSVGAGGTAIVYQWQTNGVDIAGANGSSYTISQVLFSDELNYRVIVSNACSGLSVISSNAFLDVLNPWTFFAWDNGGGDNLFSNTNNWSPDGLPYVQDFAGDFVTNLLVINADWAVDTFRTGAGATVLHTNGTLTIVNGVWTDNGVRAGEFGDNNNYTLNGGNIQINDPDGFHVGTADSAVSTFTFLSGNITNLAGDTHVGLDGIGTWNQSGGVLRAGGVQIGRFVSSNATVNLSGTAQWNVGLVLLADGHDNPGVTNWYGGVRNPGPASLNITGPMVDYVGNGLVVMQEGNVTFDGTGGGFSTVNLGGGIFLINNGELYIANPPKPATLGQEIVLMSNVGSHVGADTQFDNAPDGTVYNVPCGGQWTLDYRPDVGATNIVLVATAVPAAVNISSITVSSGTVTIQFAAGVADSAGCFELWGSPTVNGTYASLGTVITSLGSGNFQTTVPVAGAMNFYRIRRQ
jgi:hypothetical protein